VDICAQPNVIGQIPPNVIGIVIDHDVISAPVPVATITHIVGSNREEEATYPEALWAATSKSPNVLRTNGLGKTSVLPCTTDAIVRIGAAGVMPDPVVVLGVDVRSLWMPSLISERAPFRGGRRLVRSPDGSRTMCRNVAAAYSAFSASGPCRLTALVAALREHGDSKKQNHQKQLGKNSHFHSSICDLYD
jgi:hypothetical protein